MEFLGYYKLYWNTFAKNWKANLDWRGYGVELLSTVITGGLFIQGNGWKAVLDNPGNFLLNALALPGALAVLYSLYHFLVTPVELFSKKQKLAWRRTWRDVEFSKHYFEDNRPISKVGFSVVSHKPSDYFIQYFCSNVISIRTNSGKVYGDSSSDPKIQLHSYERNSLSEPFMKAQNPELHSSLNKGESILVVRVAECKDGKAIIYGYIDGVGELNPLKVVELPCTIEMELYGYISDVPPLSDKMDNCMITYVIDEDKEKGLSITMRRIPEYEYS